MTSVLPIRSGSAHPVRRVTAELGFRHAGSLTYLGAQRTPHPFHITRPFHLSGDPEGMATLYLQSSSGGLYGDDSLSLDVTAATGTAVHLTTTASTVVHAARGGRTRQDVSLDLGDDVLMEYLPEPMILFSGADLATTLTARLATGARLILADTALPHDPDGMGKTFARFSNEIEILGTDGQPLMVDRMQVSGADWARRTKGFPAHGILVVAGAIDTDAVASAVGAALASGPESGVYAAASAFPERQLVVARFLCADGAGLSLTLKSAWAAARGALTGRAPPPRKK